MNLAFDFLDFILFIVTMGLFGFLLFKGMERLHAKVHKGKVGSWTYHVRFKTDGPKPDLSAAAYQDLVKIINQTEDSYLLASRLSDQNLRSFIAEQTGIPIQKILVASSTLFMPK